MPGTVSIRTESVNNTGKIPDFVEFVMQGSANCSLQVPKLGFFFFFNGLPSKNLRMSFTFLKVEQKNVFYSSQSLKYLLLDPLQKNN